MLKYLLLLARFLGSKRNAASIILTLTLFFFSGATGVTALISQSLGLGNIDLPPYAFVVALFVFYYACASLAVAAAIWLFVIATKVLTLAIVYICQRASTLGIAHRYRQRRKQQLKVLITSLSEQQRAFLELFHADGVALQGTVIDLLPHATYMAHWDLVAKGLLVKETMDGSFVERFSLGPGTLPTLRALVFGGKTPRSEIELSLHRVAAPINSGGGAQGSSRRGI